MFFNCKIWFSLVENTLPWYCIAGLRINIAFSQNDFHRGGFKNGKSDWKQNHQPLAYFHCSLRSNYPAVVQQEFSADRIQTVNSLVYTLLNKKLLTFFQKDCLLRADIWSLNSCSTCSHRSTWWDAAEASIETLIFTVPVCWAGTAAFHRHAASGWVNRGTHNCRNATAESVISYPTSLQSFWNIPLVNDMCHTKSPLY